MGAQLAKCFDYVKQSGGQAAVMRLAMKTSISADNAASEPDSPDTLAKVQACVKELTGQEAPV